MNAKDLRPVSEYAKRTGVKMLAYGKPGSGKTPAQATAPRPVCLLIEKGAGSLSSATNIPGWKANTAKDVRDFVTWATSSNEAKQFDTINVDSLSEYCEFELVEAKKQSSHGMQQYGIMAEEVMKTINKLYNLENKHLYVTAKEVIVEIAKMQVMRPYFPGKALNTLVPHLFDTILHAEKTFPPGGTKEVNAFRTQETFEILARDRYGKLPEFVPQDLTYIINASLN